MRHRVRSHQTFANVISLVALFVALGGTAAAAVIITDNSEVASNTISGHMPPAGKHANIISGSINGVDVAADGLGKVQIAEGSLTGNAKKLLFSSGLQPPTAIATVGPYTIKGACEAIPGVQAVTRLIVNGPAGAADYMVSETRNDNADLGTSSNTVPIAASTDTEIVTVAAADGNLGRKAGTAVIRTAFSILVHLDFQVVIDARPGASGGCFIYGTATRAT